MAVDWNNLGDPSAFDGLPLPASPVTASGEDPDEVRLNMMPADMRAQAQMSQLNRRIGNVQASTAVPTAMGPAPAPGGPASNIEPAGFNADVARQAMSGQLDAGRRLAGTADEMQPDPSIAQLQQKKMQDEASGPNAADYKPGFGTRLLRGLKATGLGLAEGGIFGAAAGAIDPSLVRGGTAYGAPTDAYDTALAKNKAQVAQDTEALGNAAENFKTAQNLREKRLGGYKDSGESFKGAGTTATTQESEEEKAARIPIDQQNANTEAEKAFNESPEGKLQVTQQQVESRTQQADRMRMPQGYARTRYILTGEIQPAREASAEEVAVNRILQSYTREHQGQGPKTVQDWQSIYAAAKGGGGAAGADPGKGLREAASLAEKRVKDLEALMGSKGAVLWSPEEKAQHESDLQAARQEADTYRAQLVQTPGGGAGAPGGPAPQPAPAGGATPPKNAQATVRMKLPDGRIARFTPENAKQAKALGAQEVQ